MRRQQITLFIVFIALIALVIIFSQNSLLLLILSAVLLVSSLGLSSLLDHKSNPFTGMENVLNFYSFWQNFITIILILFYLFFMYKQLELEYIKNIALLFYILSITVFIREFRHILFFKSSKIRLLKQAIVIFPFQLFIVTCTLTEIVIAWLGETRSLKNWFQHFISIFGIIGTIVTIISLFVAIFYYEAANNREKAIQEVLNEPNILNTPINTSTNSIGLNQPSENETETTPELLEVKSTSPTELSKDETETTPEALEVKSTSPTELAKDEIETAPEPLVLESISPTELPEDKTPIESSNDEDIYSVAETVEQFDPRYRTLAAYLNDHQWKEADKETLKIMLDTSSRTTQGWLRRRDIENMSEDDLRLLCDLWDTSSKGKFGFTVQYKLWLQLDCDYGEFSKAVRWENISFKDLDDSEDAPLGHFPSPKILIGESLYGLGSLFDIVLLPILNPVFSFIAGSFTRISALKLNLFSSELIFTRIEKMFNNN